MLITVAGMGHFTPFKSNVGSIQIRAQRGLHLMFHFIFIGSECGGGGRSGEWGLRLGMTEGMPVDANSEISLGWRGNCPQTGEGKTAHPPPQLSSILLHLPLALFLLLPSPPFPSCTAGQGAPGRLAGDPPS